jgi:Ca-activated chloride channel family protein
MLFTSDPDVLRSSLHAAIGTRGRTALYDAVSSGLEQLSLGVHSRKVLVVLSDGGDNASTSTMEQIASAATASNTVIYTIALRDPDDTSARPKLLKKLAQSSGGMSFEPHSPAAIAEAFTRVARDIRASYSIAYAPPHDGAGRRQVRVTARAPDGATLAARTRADYLAR